MSQELAKKALSRASLDLLRNKQAVFFVHMYLSMKKIWEPDVKTAATDGIDIFIAPDFFISLGRDERLFLLMHETLHVALKHCNKSRVKDKDPELWNMAADYVINLMIKDVGLKMPSGGLIDERFRDKAVETVYDILVQESVQAPADFMQDIQPPDEDGPDDDPRKEAEIDKQVDSIVRRAAMAASVQGVSEDSLPPDFRRTLEDLRNPTISWEVQLRRFMKRAVKIKRDYSKVNRRYLPTILPKKGGKGIVDLAIIIDTSGSTYGEIFERFIAEAFDIAKSLQPKKTIVGQFGCSLHSVEEFNRHTDVLDVEFKEGGGTNIRPVIDWICDNRPKLTVIFTDGYFRKYDKVPGSPIIWAIDDNETFSADYGEVVHLKE